MAWFNSVSFSEYMLHSFCYLRDPPILWLRVVSNGVIAFSYYCIPVVFVYFIRKNRDMALDRIFRMFGTFILACGTTYLLEIWNVWHSSFLLVGILKATTATVFLLTAAMLILLVPKVISLPGRIPMQRHEIAERLRSENALKESLEAGEKTTSNAALSGRTARSDESGAEGKVDQNAFGQNTGIGGAVFDVTERHQAEEALLEREMRFQAMANGISQVAWMAEADGHIFWYNQRWYDYTGTKQKDMEGSGWQSVHEPARFPEVLERWRGSIVSGEPFDMEFPLRAADGQFRMFLTRIMPVKDADGHVVRWFGTSTDISECKQAEVRMLEQARELARSREALEAQSAMFKLVLDNMGEGLVATDLEGHFLVWNNAAYLLLGRAAEDSPPEQWTEHYKVLLPDGITPYPKERLPLVRALRGESADVELIVHTAENQSTFLEVTARPLRDGRGNLCGGVAVLRDVTRSRENEREIRKLNDELERRVIERTAQLEAANQELEAFSYSVSHDLRAPLRHISGFSQLLTEEFGSTLDPAAQQYLDRIQAGVQKMGVLVDELLNLACVNRHALRLQPTGLNSIVAEVVAMLQPECQGRQVEWKIADLPAVRCDPVLVKQIFQNLLTNALKFTRQRVPAIVEVAHQEENGQIVILVRDNGIGFNMKYVDKLFRVFQRLHRAEDFEGTGIGLATVQRIVQKHGGRVWAEAEVDRGATFYFTLGAEKEAKSKNNAATAGGRS